MELTIRIKIEHPDKKERDSNAHRLIEAETASRIDTTINKAVTDIDHIVKNGHIRIGEAETLYADGGAIVGEWEVVS